MVFPPILSHLDAPHNLVPIPGKKTANEINKFIIKKNSDVFLKNDNGIAKTTNPETSPITTEINW